MTLSKPGSTSKSSRHAGGQNQHVKGKNRDREPEPVPVAFDELMPKTLATATVDRLMHHAHVCPTAGDSIRLSQALAGKGAMPLAHLNPTPSGGRHRADLMATSGQISMTVPGQFLMSLDMPAALRRNG